MQPTSAYAMSGVTPRPCADASGRRTTLAASLSGSPTRKSADELLQGLRGMYYDTVSGSPSALASACQAFGASCATREKEGGAQAPAVACRSEPCRTRRRAGPNRS
jgi:hypothetical protein